MISRLPVLTIASCDMSLCCQLQELADDQVGFSFDTKLAAAKAALPILQEIHGPKLVPQAHRVRTSWDVPLADLKKVKLEAMSSAAPGGTTFVLLSGIILTGLMEMALAPTSKNGYGSWMSYGQFVQLFAAYGGRFFYFYLHLM